MTARTEVRTLLAAHIPADIDLIPYARQIDPPSVSTVMIRTDEVKPSKDASGLRDWKFALVLIAAKTTAGPGDDELEDLLADVLFALDKASPAGITWESAQRATYNESNPAFEVTISVAISKE